jgi:hypothetical protein
MGSTTLPWYSCIIRLPGPAPRQNGSGWTNTIYVSPGPRDSIFRRDGSPTGPHYLDPRTIRGFDLVKGVTLQSWPMIDISKGIGATKKRHSIDGPHRPRLRGNRQHHYAQAHTRRANLPEDHFGCPLCREGSQTLSHELRQGASGTALLFKQCLQLMQFWRRSGAEAIRLCPGRRQRDAGAPTSPASETQDRGFRLRGIRPQAAAPGRRRR